MSAREAKEIQKKAEKEQEKKLNKKVGEVLVSQSFRKVDKVKQGNDGPRSLYMEFEVFDNKKKEFKPVLVVGGGMADVQKTGKPETMEHFRQEIPRRLAKLLKKKIEKREIHLSRNQLKEPYTTQIKGEKKKEEEEEEEGEEEATVKEQSLVVAAGGKTEKDESS